MIKTMLKSLQGWLGFPPVWNRYPKDSHTKRSIIDDYMIKLKIDFAKNNMCLITIWSTETIPIA